jgi:uncharacterized protein (DUF488 family)
VLNVPIYTIGYGNRSIEEFIVLLQHYQIQFLIDVRSHPYSRFNPQFSKAALEGQLKQAGIRYVFMGDTLGGRPNDSACYLDGKVNYTKVREKPFYQTGIGRIHTAWEKQLRVALMCSETKPQECHRSKLIGRTLIEQDIDVRHIDEVGELKTQTDVNEILVANQSDSQLSLFDQESAVISNEKLDSSL